MRPASLGLFIHYSGIRQTQLITVPGLIALPVLALLGLPEHCLTIKGTTLPKRFKSTANEMHFHCHRPVPLACQSGQWSAARQWDLPRLLLVSSSSRGQSGNVACASASDDDDDELPFFVSLFCYFDFYLWQGFLLFLHLYLHSSSTVRWSGENSSGEFRLNCCQLFVDLQFSNLCI